MAGNKDSRVVAAVVYWGLSEGCSIRERERCRLGGAGALETGVPVKGEVEEEEEEGVWGERCIVVTATGRRKGREILE